MYKITEDGRKVAMLSVGSAWGLTSRREDEKWIGGPNLDEHTYIEISLSGDEIIFRLITNSCDELPQGSHTLAAVNLESLVYALQDAKYVEISRRPYRVKA